MKPNEKQAVDEQLQRETKRLLNRYLEEIVLPLQLCPWAGPALERGEVSLQILLDAWTIPQDLATVGEAIRTILSEVTAESDLVLIVLPRLNARRLQMDDLLRKVRASMDRTFALAAFHPDAAQDTSSPQRFIPYLRRSPEPLLQAVRQKRLDEIPSKHPTGTCFLDLSKLGTDLGSSPPRPCLRDQIAEANFERAVSFGLDRLDVLFESIHEDRRRTHERLQTVLSPRVAS
jgi:hypothetical protein